MASEDIGWVDLEVRPDVTGFGSSLGRGLNGPLDSVGRSSGKRFGGIMGKAALATAGGVLAAGYAAISIGKDAYAEAKEARKVAALTTSTIKATGGAANISAKQVGKLSESIMKKTAIDDEVIQSGANLLLTFKNVRNEVGKNNKIFDEATAAAVDLSAAGFGSIESSSKMLGKTLNDPVKGITALSRAGVTFTQQQKDKIASLVEENDLLGAQKIILGEVQSQVGGAAAAQADAGDKLSVTIGNIKEDIGTALMPTIDRFADWLSDKGPAAGRKFSGWIKDDAIPAIGNLYDEVKPLAEELLPVMGDVLGTVKDVLKDALPIAKDFVGAFNDMPDWAKKLVIGGGLAALALPKVPTGGKGGLGGVLGSAKGTNVYVTNWAMIRDGKPDLPGKGGKTPWLAGLGLPFVAGVGGLAAMHATPDDGSRNSAAPGSGGYAGDGGMTLPPSAQNMDGLDKGLQGIEDWIVGLAGGKKAAHDFGAAIEDQIPLAELLGGTATKTGQSVSFLSDRFKALPDKVETAVKTPGLIQSRSDVMDLKRKYDLTPREVKTVLRSLGFDDAITKAERTKRAMDLLRDKTITVTTVYQTRNAAKENRDAEASGNGRVTADPNQRQAVVIRFNDDREFGGYVDDRIHANGRLTG